MILTSGDVLLHVLRYTQEGQRLMNTTHRMYVGPTIPDATLAIEHMMGEFVAFGGWIDRLADELTPDILIQDQYTQKIWPFRMRAQRANIVIAGRKELPSAPINSAMTITKYTDFAERWGIGSWHQPGLPASAMQSSGTWSPAAQAAVRTAIGDWLSTTLSFPMDAPVGELTPILFAPGDPARTTKVVDVTSQNTIRTMRRRTVHVGQ